MKTAKIGIKDLKVHTIIGTNADERVNKQEIIINIEIETDISQAIISDDNKDTVDYYHLTNEITQFVNNSNFYLIERLSYFILKLIMKHENIIKAYVRLDKPNALPDATSAFVEIHS